MNGLFVLTLSLFAVCANAQITKCKYDANEVDSFTGYRIVKTKFYPIGSTEKADDEIRVSVRKVDSTYFMFVTGIPGECISSHDTEVFFKTVVGDIYSLKHIGEVDCGSKVYVGTVSAPIAPIIMVRVDKKEIRSLGMSMVRISTGKVYANIPLAMPMVLKQIFDCADNAPMAKNKK